MREQKLVAAHLQCLLVCLQLCIGRITQNRRWSRTHRRSGVPQHSGKVLNGLKFVSDRKEDTYTTRTLAGSLVGWRTSQILNWPMELTAATSVLVRKQTAFRLQLSAASVTVAKWQYVDFYEKFCYHMHQWNLMEQRNLIRNFQWCKEIFN